LSRLEEGYSPTTTTGQPSDSTGRATGVVCGDEVFDADAVIFAVGVSGMQKIVSSSPSLHSHKQFRTSAIWGQCTCDSAVV